MFIVSSDQLRHPFSMTCRECDAGMDMTSPEQAIAAGWTEIVDAADEGFMEANYLGLCPDCKKAGE
jgi:hypothetical protein